MADPNSKISFIISEIQQKGKYDGDFVYCEGSQSKDKNNYIIIFRRDQMTQGMILLLLKDEARFTMVPDDHILRGTKLFDVNGWTKLNQAECLDKIPSFFDRNGKLDLLATTGEKLLFDDRIKNFAEETRSFYSSELAERLNI